MHWNTSRSLPESGIPHQLAWKTHQVRCLYHGFVHSTGCKAAEGAVPTHPINVLGFKRKFQW